MPINMNRFSDMNLLVITPAFPDKDNNFNGGSFVKNQLEPMKKIFHEIIVISPVLFSIHLLKSDKFCEDYSYDNVRVFFPRCIYVPWSLQKISKFNTLLWDNRLNAVKNTILKYHIEFDLIHAHFTWPSTYIGGKLKKEYGTPVIATIHEDSGWLNEELSIRNRHIEDAWRSADALIRVNKKDVPALICYNPEVHSIPNGFGQNFHMMDTKECREALHLPQDKHLIFSLGALESRKGFSYLIEAIKILVEKRTDLVCFIGGSGHQKQQLQRQINDLNLEEHIHLIGFVPDETLSLWMNACDFFVLPSLNEGNPTVMFESLGCGKPFIGTYVGGISEIITSDQYGLVVKPGDAQGLADALTRALSIEWNREAIREYAEQFSWDAIANDVLHVYSHVLDATINSVNDSNISNDHIR